MRDAAAGDRDSRAPLRGRKRVERKLLKNAQRTAAAEVKALKQAHMPIGAYVSYTAVNDPNHLLGRPGQYTSKVNFRDTRLKGTSGFDVEGGGSVEVFGSSDDAKRRYEYISAIGKTSMFAEYDYLEGLVLLRLSHVLTPAQAHAYLVALKKVG